MAVTLNVRNSITYCQTILKNQRGNVNNLEPGLTAANTVLQRMLGAPFIWRQNRGNFTIDIATADGTDYVQSISDLGRIETQWLTDGNGKIFELKGDQSIAQVGTIRKPTTVAPVYDDNQGNVTFRFNSIPDANYTAFFDYQRKATLLKSYGQNFGPMPDEFGYLFNRGMLFELALLVNDSRAQVWGREFVAGLLATQDGLDAQAKQIFYDQMLNDGRTSLRSQGLAQAGNTGRQV